MIDDAVVQARKLFSGSHNCAQSVMKAILGEMNLDFKQVVPLTAGFGGGMVHEGSVCGAVSGAIAAIGVLNSKHFADVQSHKDATNRSGEEFIRRFKEKHGSILCNNLTGINIADAKARKAAMAHGTFAKLCPAFVESAVRIALEIAPA